MKTLRWMYLSIPVLALCAPAPSYAQAEGCWSAPISCEEIRSDWSDNNTAFNVHFTNVCNRNIYVRICNATSNGGYDCGDDDSPPGVTHTQTTYGGATGQYRYWIAGSANPNEDWICTDSSHANWSPKP